MVFQNIKLKLTDMSKIIIDLSNFTLREESPTSKHDKKKNIDYSTVLVESTVIFVPPSN
jgi:hypothetical protein